MVAEMLHLWCIMAISGENETSKLTVIIFILSFFVVICLEQYYHRVQE